MRPALLLWCASPLLFGQVAPEIQQKCLVEGKVSVFASGPPDELYLKSVRWYRDVTDSGVDLPQSTGGSRLTVVMRAKGGPIDGAVMPAQATITLVPSGPVRYDPDFLKTYDSRAESVEIGESGRKTVQLKLFKQEAEQ